MPHQQLFPFVEYLWLYGLFFVLVLGVLAVDLGVLNREDHVITFRQATMWSLVWVTIACLFNLALYEIAKFKFGQEVAKEVALEFLTGYVIEKSLSVDNIFVFVVVFNFFAVPTIFQHRVLFYGILGALIFRGLFIALGAILMQYKAVVYLFGAFLIVTGIRLMFQKAKELDPSRNWLIRLLKRHLPITDTLHGHNFFTKINGVRMGTPLLVALIVLELTDIIFAVDSVPAIFAITNEPMIVFTSNIFAMLGLRSLYFVLSGVVGKFHLLKYGLALVLCFVGLKMLYLNDLYEGHFPILVSLLIIAIFIGGSIVASFLFKQGK